MTKIDLRAEQSNFDRKVLIFLLSAIFVILAGIWARHETAVVKIENKCQPLVVEEIAKIQRPRYVLYDNTTTTWLIYLVTAVLSRLNLERVELNGSLPQELPMDSWDLLWTFPYQSWNLKVTKLNPYQKINHIPGNVAFASKFYLATETDSKYIPKAFKNNENFQKYATEYPNKKFITKAKTNRGVKLMNASEIIIEENKSHLIGNFVQEFIENPLLWDGHKFDIAAYVAITSVNPLRLYYYDRHFHLRFTPKPYNISDPNDIQSYVIDSSHHGADKFMFTKKYLDKDFGYNEAIEEFFKSKGRSLEEIRVKIENLIREIVLSKEEHMIKELERIKSSKWNYFELFRFDMILDENFNLYLLEVNMSPNIHGDKPPFQPLFENVIYSFFQLVGVATNYHMKYFGDFRAEYERMILVDRSVLAINPNDCMSIKCNVTCEEECELCRNCMVADGWKRELIVSYQEQMNSGHFRRLFPPTQNLIKSDENLMKNLTKPNEKLTKWYTGMCKKNLRFC